MIEGFFVGLIGVWMFQDGLASILHYLRTDENWHYNHMLRIFRCIGGLILVYLGWVILSYDVLSG